MSDLIGRRVCIVGLSSSGKSTLAEIIARKKGLELLQLDQLYHMPNTQWQPRVREEFHADHDAFIKKDKRVIDGTYNKCLAQRLRRADTLIILKFNRWGSLFRFVKRAFGCGGKRIGIPAGAQERVNLELILFILKNARKRYAALEKRAAENPHLKIIRLKSFKEIDAFVARL